MKIMLRPSLLALDCGNTSVKATLFGNVGGREPSGKKPLDIIDTAVWNAEDLEERLGEWNRNHRIPRVAVCSSGMPEGDIVTILRRLGIEKALVVGESTPVPVAVEYDRSRLGSDRLCAAVGCHGKHPVLVADVGTALTLDLVTRDAYCGGSISPGIRMRLDAMNYFTARLPEVSPEGEAPLVAHDTAEAMRSGAVRGTAFEIAGKYRMLRKTHKGLKLVLAGGDARLVEPMLQEMDVEYQTVPGLVAIGMWKIYVYNNDTTITDE